MGDREGEIPVSERYVLLAESVADIQRNLPRVPSEEGTAEARWSSKRLAAIDRLLDALLVQLWEGLWMASIHAQIVQKMPSENEPAAN